MKYWYECKLDAWRDHEKPGDMYIPYRPYVRMMAEAEFEYPTCEICKPPPNNYPDPMNSCYYMHRDREADRMVANNWMSFDGRGIVICAGGRFLPGAYVTVKLLREFGCDLPVEIWHLGPDEIPDVWRSIFDGLGVVFCDAHEYMKSHPIASLSGWQLKNYSIIFSRFQEVLFLDADNHPTKNPAYLFDSDEYQSTGAVFWPDRVPHDKNHPLWDVFGVEYREEPAHETGQMLIDKKKCWHALQIAMHCNEFSDFHYRYSHGDTALLRFSFHTLGQPFTIIPHRLIEVPVDREVEDLDALKDAAYMRKPGDIRACFLQRDFDGDVIFQHRSGGGGAQVAFKLRDNAKIQHFRHEELCLKILDGIGDALVDIPFWERMSLLHPEKISPHRKAGMKVMFETMGDRPLTIVETGTMRQRDNWHNDGGFTWWLGAYANAHGGEFTTVDNDPEAIELSKELTPELGIVYVTDDSAHYLSNWKYTSKINVLLLDSFDYTAGFEKQSQTHNMNEVIAALPHMADDGIIVIDDYGLAGGGKGGLSVPYLEGMGWKIIHKGYMVILRKGG